MWKTGNSVTGDSFYINFQIAKVGTALSKIKI